jgi:hypothetical protein
VFTVFAALASQHQTTVATDQSTLKTLTKNNPFRPD